MCLETNKIIKIRVVVFMEDRGNIKNYLEMHPSERNESLAMVVVVVVDKYFKSPLFDGTGQFVDNNDEVEGNKAAIEKTREGPANDDIIVEKFDEKLRYPMRKWQPLRE
jgi:hypothetical protein